jgi:hypothetical protein
MSLVSILVSGTVDSCSLVIGAATDAGFGRVCLILDTGDVLVLNFVGGRAAIYSRRAGRAILSVSDLEWPNVSVCSRQEAEVCNQSSRRGGRSSRQQPRAAFTPRVWPARERNSRSESWKAGQEHRQDYQQRWALWPSSVAGGCLSQSTREAVMACCSLGAEACEGLWRKADDSIRDHQAYRIRKTDVTGVNGGSNGVGAGGSRD